MNLILCDNCGNRNIMCFGCEQNKHYRESNRSHDEHIKREAIKEFANIIVERLKNELTLADKEKKRFVRENVLQFDSVKGYSSGMYMAIEIVKAELNQTDI